MARFELYVDGWMVADSEVIVPAYSMYTFKDKYLKTKLFVSRKLQEFRDENLERFENRDYKIYLIYDSR